MIMHPIVKNLIIIDLFVFSGLGLLNPIFAVFVKEKLIGGSLAAVGIASTLYLITKALLQLPLAKWMDVEKGFRREFFSLIVGYGLIALTPFSYLFIRSVFELYLVQIIYGIGAALAYPGFMSIFTRFADHEKAAFSWSFYSTSTLLGMALAAGVGGVIAEIWGFYVLLFCVATLVFFGFFSTLFLFLFYDQLNVAPPLKLMSLWHRLFHLFSKKKTPIPPGKIDLLK